MATSVASQLAKLRKEREALEKREKALQTRTHTRAIEKILAIAKDAGLSAADISAAMGGGKKKSGEDLTWRENPVAERMKHALIKEMQQNEKNI